MKPVEEPRSRMAAARCGHIVIRNGVTGMRLCCTNDELVEAGYLDVATTLDVCQVCPLWQKPLIFPPDSA